MGFAAKLLKLGFFHLAMSLNGFRFQSVGRETTESNKHSTVSMVYRLELTDFAGSSWVVLGCLGLSGVVSVLALHGIFQRKLILFLI